MTVEHLCIFNLNHRFILPVELLSFAPYIRDYRNSAISLEINHSSECQPTSSCQYLHLFSLREFSNRADHSARELTLFRAALPQRPAGGGGKYPLPHPCVYVS